MTKKIKLKNSVTSKLPYLSDAQFKQKFDKGWSFSSVYHFNELKDIFLLIKEKGFADIKSFTILCKEIGIVGINTDWKDRRVLEQLNALKNFELISNDYKIIKYSAFKYSQIGAQLTNDDLKDFENIFFSYIRFQEITNWFFKSNSLFINFSDLQNEKVSVTSFSSVIFSFSRFNRFTDSLIYSLIDNTEIFFIENSDKDLMRFWDVFLKWGHTLKLIQKINLNMANVTIDSFKNSQCIYFINKNNIVLNLREYIHNNFKNKYVYIPDLVFKIAVDYRYSVESIKTFIISEYENNKFIYNLDRASEIFINKSAGGKDEVVLHPIYKGSFVSHLMLL